MTANLINSRFLGKIKLSVKGYATHNNGKRHPVHEKKGINENQLTGNRKEQVGSMIPVNPKDNKNFKSEGHGLPDVSVHRHNWTFETEKGKITKLSLGNLTDAGWYWSSDMDGTNKPLEAEGDLAGYMVRLAESKLNDEFVKAMNESGITLELLRPLIKKSIEKGESGIYQISGDSRRWHFGNDEFDAKNRLFDGLEDGNNAFSKLTEKQQEIVQEKFWNNFSATDYDDFEKEYGEQIKGILLKGLEESSDIDDLFSIWSNWDATGYPIEEIYSEYQDEKSYEALNKTIEKVKKENK